MRHIESSCYHQTLHARLKDRRIVTGVLVAFTLILCCKAILQLQRFRSAYGGSRDDDVRISTTHDARLFQRCLETKFDASSLRNVSNIVPAEFLERRDRLAEAIHASSVDAFVVEPGYTFFYYANLSQSDWEPWEPEERPFLMIVLPDHNGINVKIKAKTLLLVASFEVQRALLSNIPHVEESDIVLWEEDEDPFQVLSDYMSNYTSKPPREITVIVDEELRHFIADGLQRTGINVNGLSIPISKVREIKSVAEIAILRAINTATVAGVAAVQRCLEPGLTEKIIETSLNKLYMDYGLTPFFNIVLIEEDAAVPHGGVNGERKLARDDFVLIDVGVHLYYYSSDIARTFLMESAMTCNTTASGCPGRNETMFSEKLRTWDIVLEAQKAAIEMMRPHNTAASVDLAARRVIDRAGYEKAFTHRLGHGIGVKAHEPPYLNRGNFGRTLSAGMCFTAEPGIYISGAYGVRHEDVILVTNEKPELLTGDLARSPWHL